MQIDATDDNFNRETLVEMANSWQQVLDWKETYNKAPSNMCQLFFDNVYKPIHGYDQAYIYSADSWWTDAQVTDEPIQALMVKSGIEFEEYKYLSRSV